MQEAELTSDLRLTAAAVLCNGANTKNNPRLLLRVQQEEIESALESSPEQGEEYGADEEESEHSSNEQDELLQDAARTPLNEDSHQHGLMLAAYREVGGDFSVDNGQLVNGAGDPEVL